MGRRNANFFADGRSLARTRPSGGNQPRFLGSARLQPEHRAAGEAGDRFQLRGHLLLRDVAPVLVPRLPIDPNDPGRLRAPRFSPGLRHRPAQIGLAIVNLLRRVSDSNYRRSRAAGIIEQRAVVGIDQAGQGLGLEITDDLQLGPMRRVVGGPVHPR